MKDDLSEIEKCILKLLLPIQNEPFTLTSCSIPWLKHDLDLFGFELSKKTINRYLFDLKKENFVKKWTIPHTDDVRFKISDKGKNYCKKYGITPP